MRDDTSFAHNVPQHSDDWDTTDSIMSGYRPACDRVVEVRMLRQLTACVDEIT